MVLDPDARVGQSAEAVLCPKVVNLFGSADHPPYLVDGDVLPLARTSVDDGQCVVG